MLSFGVWKRREDDGVENIQLGANMEKVVSRGIKMRLHIHSEYSKAKDGKKVRRKHIG